MSQDVPNSDQRERELVEKVAQGDEVALRALYDMLAPNAVALATKVLRDPELAEEVVQDVFVTIWNEPTKYDSTRGSVASMVMTWTKNRAIDRVRRQSAYDRAKQRASDRVNQVLEPITRADQTGLENALSTLPDEQRQLLERMYYEGMTQTEIADQTGIALGTVKSRIRLGMSRLRESFMRLAGSAAFPKFRGQGKNSGS